MDNETPLRYIDIEDLPLHDKFLVREFIFPDAIVANGSLMGGYSHDGSLRTARFLACLIYNAFRKKNRPIVIAITSEGFPGDYMRQADRIFKILKESYKISDTNFHYVSSASPVKHNFDLYNDYCNRYDWLPVKLHLCNMWEYSSNHNLKLSLSEAEKIITEPITKPKKVLCLNGVSRAHRLYVAGEFILRNLFEYSYYSFLNRDCITNELETLHGVVEENNLSNSKYEEIKNALTIHKNEFPKLLTYPVSNPSHHIIPEDVPLYNETYFSLVNETLYFVKQINTMNEVTMDCFFITEKTFRPIMAKHPFIIAGRPHILKHLRDIGYKTFSPFIDESYDDIEDDELRLQRIMDIVEHMCKNFSDSDWIEFQKNTLEIRLHNYNKLLHDTTITVKTMEQL